MAQIARPKRFPSIVGPVGCVRVWQTKRSWGFLYLHDFALLHFAKLMLRVTMLTNSLYHIQANGETNNNNYYYCIIFFPKTFIG